MLRACRTIAWNASSSLLLTLKKICKKEKGKFTLFSDRNGSLLRWQPRAQWDEDLLPFNSSPQQSYYRHVGIRLTWQQPQPVMGTMYMYSKYEMLCVCHSLGGVMWYSCLDDQACDKIPAASGSMLCFARQAQHTFSLKLSICRQQAHSHSFTELAQLKRS